MDVLFQAGEAIGNVGRKLFRRKRRSEVQEALARWLERVPRPVIPCTPGVQAAPREEVVEAAYRVIRGEQAGDRTEEQYDE